MIGRGEVLIKDLFEDMRKATGAMYQSDLKYRVPKEQIIQIARMTELERYPLAMWKEFFCYVRISIPEKHFCAYEDLNTWFISLRKSDFTDAFLRR